jgi:hypothetical protein
MNDRAFTEKLIIPESGQIEEVLKDTYEFYKKLMMLVSGYDSKWTYYKGWSQKVFDKKKALFYLAPFWGAFEKLSLLDNAALKLMHELIRDGESFTEGIKIQLDIEDAYSFEASYILIEAVIKLRTLRKKR